MQNQRPVAKLGLLFLVPMDKPLQRGKTLVGFINQTWEIIPLAAPL